MNWNSILTLIISIVNITNASSQTGGLAAYVDYRQRFFVFDHGEVKMLEEQEVRSFKIGGNCIAYVDFADNFKVYSQGRVKMLEPGGVYNYKVTDNLIAYTISDVCYVYDRGKKRQLSAQVKDFAIGDNIIVFFDYYYNTINIYYDENVFSRKLRLIGEKIQRVEASDNIAGIVTAEDRNFWIFYNGDLELINDFVESVNFKAGKDIVAYIDEPTNTFRAYYQGSIYDIDNFKPREYKMGDARTVYIDNLGNFKTFYDCQIATILKVEPTFYEVKDSMIIFQELDRLYCYYQDRIYEVAEYIPDRIEFERDIIVYLDRSKNLQVFRNGKSELIFYGGQNMLNDFKLVRDVIIMNVGVNETLIYWKGKYYK